jgi:hypothetical protein
VAIAVDTSQGSQDVVRGVRNQYRVVVRTQRTSVTEKIEQMRHLLEIGWDIRVVATQVSVIELDVDEMLDFASSRIEIAGALSSRG